MILGVSEWLGKKLDMKTEHVRIGFLLALILAGSGVLLYLIFFVIKSIKNE
jgi:phage shock protein PspC (stress-responsive transcriptional regulator)